MMEHFLLKTALCRGWVIDKALPYAEAGLLINGIVSKN